jgi:hypothetical protein
MSSICTLSPPWRLRPPRHLGPAQLKRPCITRACLYSWSVPVQLNPTNVRIYVLCAWHSHTAGEGCTIPISSDKRLLGGVQAKVAAGRSGNSWKACPALGAGQLTPEKGQAERTKIPLDLGLFRSDCLFLSRGTNRPKILRSFPNSAQFLCCNDGVIQAAGLASAQGPAIRVL